jgi:hypothetical protein
MHSALWKTMNISNGYLFNDLYNGFAIDIDQYDFGHVAHKPTRLYICGCTINDIPSFQKRTGKPIKSITGQVKNTKRCTQYEREYTPLQLAKWLIDIATNCKQEQNHG